MKPKCWTNNKSGATAFLYCGIMLHMHTHTNTALSPVDCGTVMYNLCIYVTIIHLHCGFLLYCMFMSDYIPISN